MRTVRLAFQILRLLERLMFDMSDVSHPKTDKMLELYMTGIRLIHQPLFAWIRNPKEPLPDLERHLLAFQGASDNLCFYLSKYGVADFEVAARFSSVTERVVSYYDLMQSSPVGGVGFHKFNTEEPEARARRMGTRR